MNKSRINWSWVGPQPMFINMRAKYIVMERKDRVSSHVLSCVSPKGEQAIGYVAFAFWPNSDFFFKSSHWVQRQYGGFYLGCSYWQSILTRTSNGVSRLCFAVLNTHCTCTIIYFSFDRSSIWLRRKKWLRARSSCCCWETWNISLYTQFVTVTQHVHQDLDIYNCK